MNELQRLALRHVYDLADQVDRESIRLCNTLGADKVDFNAENHIYPIAEKARRIGHWVEAILECEE